MGQQPHGSIGKVHVAVSITAIMVSVHGSTNHWLVSNPMNNNLVIGIFMSSPNP